MLILAIYISLFILVYITYTLFQTSYHKKKSAYRKTVTFGDESSVKSNRIASVSSIAVLFFIWAAFTDSSLIPVHMPGPFTGDTHFIYSATNSQNQTDNGTVYIRVGHRNEKFSKPREM